MAEPNPFFRWLYRGLAVVALVALVGVGVLALRLFGTMTDWRKRDAIAVAQRNDAGTVVTETVHFGDLEVLRGSGTRLLRVSVDEDGNGRALSGSYGSPVVRNLVFIDAGYGQGRWLFPHNRARIDGIRTLCACASDDADASPVTALYLQVRDRDTDADGRIDAGDRVVPALLRPDGTGYRPLMAPVDAVLDSATASDGRSLGLLVHAGASVLYREYTIEDGRLRSERVVTRTDQR